MRSASIRACCIRDRVARRADVVRSLYAGEFRRTLRRPHHGDGRAQPQPQHPGRLGGVATARARSLSIPARRGHRPSRERTALRARTGAGRRRSQHAGTRRSLRDARQSRRVEAAALSRGRAAKHRHAPSERRSQLHGDGHAAPACSPRRSDRRAAAAQSRLLEDRHVLGVSRCLDGGKLRAVCARRVGRQFRRLRQSRFRRRRCGSAAVLPDRGRDRSRTSASRPSRHGPSLPISNAWRFASQAASFPIAGVRKKDRPGSFPASRRSA